jgi:hypothetical protein
VRAEGRAIRRVCERAVRAERSRARERPGTPRDAAGALLIQLCDELYETDSVSDRLWARLAGRWPRDQLPELFVTAGWYRLTPCVINACGVPREPWAARFSASACLQTSASPELARPSDGFPTPDGSLLT